MMVKRVFAGLLLLAGGIILVSVSSSNMKAQSVECPTESFVDVSTGSAGVNYPAPYLNVYCTDENMIVESNGIPNFEFVQITPADLSAQDYKWTLPLHPEVAAAPTTIPLLGLVAVAVNGMPIYGPNEAADLGFGDPFLDQILDYCNGHTGPGGTYHFHARPDCLFEDSEGNTSLVLAYALDGYPILAPYMCVDADCTQVEKVNSSWQRTQDVESAWDAHEYIAGSGDLDQCNGLLRADGTYTYYATDSFPYFLGCYHGVVDPSYLQAAGDPGGNGQPPAGNAGQPPAGDPPPPRDGGNGQPPAGGPPAGSPPPGGRP